jgi:hypothetical protein
VTAYLSVDLDFWCDHVDARAANRFFEKVLGLNVPVTFVIEHEELVKDIKKVKGLTTLYNVDYHSDLVAHKDRGRRIEDHNWANFVAARKQAEFFWLVPDKDCYTRDRGTCHGGGLDPFEHPKQSGGKNCKIRSIRVINWEKIQRVGICLSPLFVEIDSVTPVIERLGVPIKKAEKLINKQPRTHTRRKRGVLKRIPA